jgi:hypothetical protein
VGQWLSGLGLTDYESLFVNYGFDDLEFIVSRHAFHASYDCDRGRHATRID